jgi:tetratricopeptide (TPR) repeat protein
MGPAEDIEPQRIVDWAAQAVKKNSLPWELHALGLAYYRAEQYDLAIENLEKSNAGDWADAAKAQNWLVLAMAHHRLERHTQAWQCLERAHQAIDRARPLRPELPTNVSVPDWLELEQLRREAETLIGRSEADEAGENKSRTSDELKQ